MKLPKEVRKRFADYGRQGGQARAARMSPEARKATASRGASSRWIRHRFGAAGFAELGLPGGDIVDAGLAHLAEGIVSPESLVVSLAAPRLRREGVPIGRVHIDPEDRLYELLSRTTAGLTHARYVAYLEQVASFADACGLARRPRTSDAK